MKWNRCCRRASLPVFVWLLVGLLPTLIYAQDPSAARPADAPATSAAPEAKDASAAPSSGQEDKRVFGVIPNYRTTENDLPFHPLTVKYKFTIGLKDSFDWPVYPTAGVFAAVYQLENANPSFGQGVKGYAHRYATALADQVIGNMMTESVMPSIFREDPRYFRLGRGSKTHRMTYALTRIFITRTDAGGRSFNFAEVVGNATGATIANAYYPDNRSVPDTVERLCISLTTDALSQVMKEFWPDVKRWMSHKHEAPPPMLAHEDRAH